MMIILLARSELVAVNRCRQHVEKDRRQLATALARSEAIAREKIVDLPTLGLIFISGCVTQSLCAQRYAAKSIAAHLATMYSVFSIVRSNL